LWLLAIESINANDVYAASQAAEGAHSTVSSALEGLVAFCSFQTSTSVFVMLCSLTLRKLLACSEYTTHEADMFVAMELTAVTFDFDIGDDVCLRRAKKKTSSQRDGIRLNISYLGIIETEDS
jgi:hypothetical protein